MKILDLLTQIKAKEEYVINSLHLKESDDYGCVYKYLTNCNNLGIRREIFIATSIEEAELDLSEKTILTYIEVFPAV
jgi:hypothetical protein